MGRWLRCWILIWGGDSRLVRELEEQTHHEFLQGRPSAHVFTYGGCPVRLLAPWLPPRLGQPGAYLHLTTTTLLLPPNLFFATFKHHAVMEDNEWKPSDIYRGPTPALEVEFDADTSPANKTPTSEGTSHIIGPDARLLGANRQIVVDPADGATLHWCSSR